MFVIYRLSLQNIVERLANWMNSYPPLWMLYAFVLVLPFVLMACCFVKPKTKVSLLSLYICNFTSYSSNNANQIMGRVSVNVLFGIFTLLAAMQLLVEMASFHPLQI